MIFSLSCLSRFRIVTKSQFPGATQLFVDSGFESWNAFSKLDVETRTVIRDIYGDTFAPRSNYTERTIFSHRYEMSSLSLIILAMAAIFNSGQLRFLVGRKVGRPP